MTARRGTFERILVPVDFSPRSANALEFAIAFGSLQHAEIEALHVWHSDLTTSVTVAKERAKSALREFVGSLELRGEVTLRRRTDHGDPYLTIQSLVQLGGHDLLVVAGPDGGNAKNGSVAKSLLSSAPCAVLFVPASARPRRRSDADRTLDLERILVPLALAGDALEALDCAEALRADSATVEVLSTSDVSERKRAALSARSPFARREAQERPEPSVLAVRERARVAPFDLVVLCGKRAQIGGRPADVRHEAVALSQQRPTLCLPG